MPAAATASGASRGALAGSQPPRHSQADRQEQECSRPGQHADRARAAGIAFEVRREVFRLGVAFGGIGHGATQADGRETARDAWRIQRRSVEITPAGPIEGLVNVPPVEWGLTGQQEVEHAAQGEQVAAPVYLRRIAACLLGGHVRRRAADLAGRPGRVEPGMPLQGHAEVNEARLAGLVDEDVVRLEVAVDDAAAVGQAQGAGPPSRAAGRLPRRQPAGADVLLQVAAAHEVHDEERMVLMEIEIVDAYQVGMIELGQQPALRHEVSAARPSRRPAPDGPA